MFSFIICLFALVLGYFLYGKVVEKAFGPEKSRITPAVSKADGVDFIVLPRWKVFMIQFLNIAGTGPIFGAIMGAKFGPSSYLWIVLGSIFAGGVHDYFSGMMSIRHDGASLPDIIGIYMGKRARDLMLVVSLVLLMLVGTVFVYSPALIFGEITGDGSQKAILIWVGIIFAYYIFATLLPIDKVIGKFYPIFAACLLFMALALMVCLFVHWPDIPEIWQGLGNKGAEAGLPGMSRQTIFPSLFITIACGALSGFHSTQSPIMARCMENERQGRITFYGAMITEGIVALIWAAVSSYFFFDGGAAAAGSKLTAAAPEVVTKMARYWLGPIGGILAIIGVSVAPITSGDTSFRSARLILADFLHLDQKPKRNRLAIAFPLFCLVVLLLLFNIKDEDGFNIIWRYFGFANLVLACFTLWTAVEYLLMHKKGAYFLIAFIPATIMTSVCVSYIFTANIGFNLPVKWAWHIANVAFLYCIIISIIRRVRSHHLHSQ